jgi:transcription-repair coupling factor (superfamily II helicase)
LNFTVLRRKFAVERSIHEQLLDVTAKAEPIAAKLRKIDNRSRPLAFSHVVKPAQPFLVATIAREIDQTLWVLCPSVRTQELFYEGLVNWLPSAQFLPEAEFAAVENILPDPEIAAERLALLSLIEREPGPHIIVATRASLEQAAPKPGALQTALLQLKPGKTAGMENLLSALSGAGYERVSQVTTRGQFAVRGGIVDLYSWQATLPARLEFFGDDIESLREFDIDTQTSVRDLKNIDVLLGQETAASQPPERSGDRPSLLDDQSGFIRDYIRDDDLKIDIEPEEKSGAHIQISENWIESGAEDFSGAFQDCDVGEFAVGEFMLVEAKRAQFVKRLDEWRKNKARVVIYFQTEGEIERFREIIGDAPLQDVAGPAKGGQLLQSKLSNGKKDSNRRSWATQPVDATGCPPGLQGVDLVEGTLARGFCFPAANIVVLSAAELFGRFAAHARRRLRRAERQRAQIDFSELVEGDYIVHLEHGVGRFLGLIKLPRSVEAGVSPARTFEIAAGTAATTVTEQEVLALEFADEAKLYVPLEQAYLVSRYVGVGKKSPPLSSLGDARWSRAKRNATASVFDYAGKMLALQAERETHPGYAFGPDTKWQVEFDHSFPFRETPDQLRAIIESKIDMERPRPMDRLICGDVGFGKTEVAIRAAFKAVMDGKQVAVLAPTTVLAQQHFEVFRQRMLDYPVRIEMLSRFRSQSEQRKILALLREGGIDIVIGTHRLISGDVVFKDLALVVIDEEQRFGVLHKEKFKDLFKLVDVLTLSATPIPRTLYLSLVGVKDMSTIETPPLNRLPVETVVCGYDERIVRDAIKRELERQGQVFFLHNRVLSIERMREKIVDLVPEARVEIGHGQMDSDELEEVMARFVAGKIDVLVCTTIIESGLDIPNANTIIIDRADRFGLADLYQLRGRVGRAEHKAYAYLLLPRELMTVGAARKRINAIKQYSSLGAGFRIAMRDLEIRGAGSILGTAQSGHIVAVGFDLYCQLLKQAVAQLKGEKLRLRLDVDLVFDFVATNEAEFVALGPKQRVPAFIPTSYIADTTLRIQTYRRFAEITSAEQLERTQREWRDRFGKFPAAVDNLFLLAEIKLAAARAEVSRVEVRERKLMLTRRGDFILVGGKFPRLVEGTIEAHLWEILELTKKL